MECKECYTKVANLNATTVIYVAKLVDIQENLNIGVEEMCCMIESLPVSRSYPNPPLQEKEKKLFERIFDVKGLFEDPATHTIKTETKFHYFAFNTDPNDTTVDQKMPILLSGLGITEGELVLLFRLLNEKIPFNIVDHPGECELNLNKISLLHRHVCLSRALRFGSIEDFVNAISVCFMVPPEPTFVIDSDDKISKITQFKNWLQSSPFNVTELSFILFGKENSSIQFSTTFETIVSMVKEAQNPKENPQEIDKINVPKVQYFKIVQYFS